MPFLAGFVIWRDRRRIFSTVRSLPELALVPLVAALAIFYAGSGYSSWLSANELPSLRMFSFVLLLIGLFTFCYGMEALRAAASFTCNSCSPGGRSRLRRSCSPTRKPGRVTYPRVSAQSLLEHFSHGWKNYRIQDLTPPNWACAGTKRRKAGLPPGCPILVHSN